MHILLNNSISKANLEMANLMLNRFYELMPLLYPETMCTLNVHSVIHMCDFIHRWGPLWCYSTFGFENLNGFIKKRCHGTRNVLPQLIQAVRMGQSLPTLNKKLSSQENTTTMGFLDKLCRQKEASIGPKEKIKNITLDSSELKVLEEAGFHVTSSLPFFPRYKHGEFVTSMAKMHNLRNNSICKIRNTDKPHVEEFFGSIQKFCFINETPITLVALFEKINEDIVSVPDLQHHHSLLENDYKAARIFNLFAVKVKNYRYLEN